MKTTKPSRLLAGCVVLLCACVFSPNASAIVDIGTDPTNKHAWGENVGWVNVGPTNGGVSVHFAGETGWLSGYAWGENIGWIKMGAGAGGLYENTSHTNWGVNLNSNGICSGYAWGENVGWIKFDPAYGGVSIDMVSGDFSGYAWGENIGWLKFKGASPDYVVRTRAFDTHPQGTPNWWLYLYGFDDENTIGAKGVPVWQDFIADTDPTEEGDVFDVRFVGNLMGFAATFLSSSRRYYTLQWTDDLTSDDWQDVPEQIGVQGTGEETSLEESSTEDARFYRIKVDVTPPE